METMNKEKMEVLVEFLRSHRKSIGLSELDLEIYKLDKSISTFDIRQMMWSLLDRHVLKFTKDRKLQFFHGKYKKTICGVAANGRL